jgi:hypothetical protein
LDWSLGYVFHETIKLKEDVYQEADYGERFERLMRDAVRDKNGALAGGLSMVTGQTRESILREIARIRFILGECRRLFPVYLAAHSENLLLARLLFEEDALIREAFGQDFAKLVEAVYGDAPELLYVYASQSLRQGGWMDEAARAVQVGCDMAPQSSLVLQEKEIVDSWQRRLTA